MPIFILLLEIYRILREEKDEVESKEDNNTAAENTTIYFVNDSVRSGDLSSSSSCSSSSSNSCSSSSSSSSSCSSSIANSSKIVYPENFQSVDSFFPLDTNDRCKAGSEDKIDFSGLRTEAETPTLNSYSGKCLYSLIKVDLISFFK